MYVSYADDDGAGKCSSSTGIILPHPGPVLADGGVTMRRRRVLDESESTSNILLSAIVFMKNSKTQTSKRRVRHVDIKHIDRGKPSLATTAIKAYVYPQQVVPCILWPALQISRCSSPPNPEPRVHGAFLHELR